MLVYLTYYVWKALLFVLWDVYYFVDMRKQVSCNVPLIIFYFGGGGGLIQVIRLRRVSSVCKGFELGSQGWISDCCFWK
jgi:hypothetical protein